MTTLVASSLFLGFTVVGADTQIDDFNMQSDAFITVSAPEVNALSLTNVPSFDFGIADAVNTQIILDTKGDSPYTIVDLTGTGNGYKVQTKIGDFSGTNDKGQPITFKMDHFYLSVANNAGTIIGNSKVDIYNANAIVLSGNENASGTQSSGEVGAEIVMNSTTPQYIAAGNYQATITHSLVSGI
jgi:hypothetical protein